MQKYLAFGNSIPELQPMTSPLGHSEVPDVTDNLWTRLWTFLLYQLSVLLWVREYCAID